VIPFKEIAASIPEGFKSMVPAILILTFAWTLKAMTDSLGAKQFVEALVKGSAGGFQSFLPAIVFLIAVGLSFATGTSWGTFGILIPITLGVTLLLILCGMSHTLFGWGTEDNLTRIEGAVFLVVFALYIWACFKFDDKSADNMEEQKTISVAGAIALVLAGLAGLIIGGKLFVESATHLASSLGVSDKFIAITVLAGGTSLPELATCVVAAAKKKGQLALGNILGSNVFNILLILGTAAVIHPISLAGINLVDMGTLLLSAVLVLLSAFTFKRNQIDRADGAVFLLCFIAYYVWLFINL
jgi:cation:H+ antiporter